LKDDFSSINHKINRYDHVWASKRANYLDYLRFVYSILESHYQNEYIYKNSFLNEFLIKEIGKNSSKVFNEFRVGNAVADLVMFNGNSKVFEIKTDFDTDIRLKLQLENYRKAFNQIYLIIPESKIEIYNKYEGEIGLITFNSNRIDKFELYRDAIKNFEIDADTILNILHTKEYKKIVKTYFGFLPEMTSFNQFNKCRDLIKKIPIPHLNNLFIKQMKNRNLDNVLSSRYYKEFNQLSLALKFNKRDKSKLIEKLKSPLNS
jgi:hypothetical protein